MAHPQILVVALRKHFRRIKRLKKIKKTELAAQRGGWAGRGVNRARATGTLAPTKVGVKFKGVGGNSLATVVGLWAPTELGVLCFGAFYNLQVITGKT